MPDKLLIILLHQCVFQGMFLVKNIILRRKIGKQIRGKNIEATIAIVYFAFFIGVSVVLSFFKLPVGSVQLPGGVTAKIGGLIFLSLNIAVSGASLVSLRDSWRVGVLEEQKTELVTTGIYRFSRNPYFLSYFLMFAAYTVLLQSLILFGLSICGVMFVHNMVLKEEKYLYSVHGDAYVRYKSRVPRYLFI